MRRVLTIAALALAAGVVLAATGETQAQTPQTSDATSDQPINAGALAGSYRNAGKDAPVVLIVPGSGPTDRNGDSPLGVKAQPYKLLAEALARTGVSTVRVDKRGMFGSAAAGDASAVTIEAYAKDYRAWIDAVRAKTGQPCVWLLGHSEGSLMVSAAAEGRADVCGLILVAGPGRKLGDVIRAQLKANPANAPLLDSAFATLAELEAGRKSDVSALHPALQQLFAPRVQGFLISVLAVDPAELAHRADKPMLVLQGTHDIQVSVEDAERLSEASPKARLVLLEGVNHVLKVAPADPAGNTATYANPDLALAPGVAEAIAAFVKGAPAPVSNAGTSP